jgi:hypothetical protein
MLRRAVAERPVKMRFRWFLYPEYYANKTWEEQAQDKFLMGHYRESRIFEKGDEEKL